MWLDVNFINNKRARFSHESLFSSYVLALNELSYEKFVRKNVDEIDTSLMNILTSIFQGKENLGENN